MTYRISSVLNILLMSLLLAGCSGPEKLKQTPIQKTTASLSPAADNTEWIKRLLALAVKQWLCFLECSIIKHNA